MIRVTHYGVAALQSFARIVFVYSVGKTMRRIEKLFDTFSNSSCKFNYKVPDFCFC